MAQLFFAQAGLDQNRAGKAQTVSASLVAEKLAQHAKKHFIEPPEINSQENVSSYSRPKLTVVEIGEGEISAFFPKAGYYWFPQVSPEQCCYLLGLGELPE